MADVLALRRKERDLLIGLARAYVERLSARMPVPAAAVGFTGEEFAAARAKGNPLAGSVLEEGVILAGEAFFRGA